MPTSFPTSLDSFTNPTAGNTLDAPPHHSQHANANDSIAALEAKVGVDSSAVTTTFDYKINNTLAPKASPALTGTPTAPTATVGTNTTQLATTAFVQTAAGLLLPLSAFTAKGDLVVGTGASTYATKAVGSDGNVLTADSASTGGVKWAAAAGGGGVSRIGKVTLNSVTYGVHPNGAGASNFGTFALTANRLYLSPFFNDTSMTLAEMYIEVTTAAASGKHIQIGVFNADNTDWHPTTVVTQGTVLADTTGVKSVTGLGASLPAGRYWTAVDAEAAVSCRYASRAYTPWTGDMTVFNGRLHVDTSQAYGSFTSTPSITGAGNTDDSYNDMLVLVAS